MEEDNDNIFYQIKCIIVGDSGVGKTCILYRYIKDEFNKYEITIGADFFHKNMTINDKKLNLQIWDTAGSEGYKSITKGYFSNTACCILVYDITRPESFKSIINWIEDVRNYNNDIDFILVGNKYDLKDERKISEEQGKALASEFDMKYIEVSAKTDYKIKDVFKIIFQLLYEKIKKNELDDDGKELNGIKKCNTAKNFDFNDKFILKVNRNNENNENIIVQRRKKCGC